MGNGCRPSDVKSDGFKTSAIVRPRGKPQSWSAHGPEFVDARASQAVDCEFSPDLLLPSPWIPTRYVEIPISRFESFV